MPFSPLFFKMFFKKVLKTNLPREKLTLDIVIASFVLRLMKLNTNAAVTLLASWKDMSLKFYGFSVRCSENFFDFSKK